MSNVIKAYSVRYDDEAKKTIDSHLRIDKELEIRKNLAVKATQVVPEGFVEGLQALVVDTISEEEQLEEISERASKLLEEAEAEAQQILEKAKKDAEQLKADTLASATKKAYEDGMQQVKKEAQKLKTEHEAMQYQLQEEHEEAMRSLEPHMAQIIVSLVGKITGILIEDKEEVILNLANRALRNMDKSDEYTIRVSKEDYEYVAMRKNLLLTAIGREVPLFVIEDINMGKNQCIIETDNKVINCSLDVQLNNLITDLKLLAGI
ncbi:MAG: hypothetical protein K0S04_738 [Herbinix sp.]|nr:hypothetical protein [Herbinix sp.]